MEWIEKSLKTYGIGCLFVGVLCLIAWGIGSLEFFQQNRISVLIVAIFVGVSCMSLYTKYSVSLQGGVSFSAKKLLRLGVVLYGFNVSFAEILMVGLEGMVLTLFVVLSVFVLGFWLGVKFLKIDRDLALLVSGGSAICGAAAVLALESVIKSEPYKGVIAVGSVVVFGLLGMFLYPFLYILLDGFFSEQQMGIYIGATLHEVANVVGAGSAVGEEAQALAVVVKMIRVLLLIPVLLLMPFLLPSSHTSNRPSLPVPWFAFAFLGVVGVNSLGVLPEEVNQFFKILCMLCLSMAMVALGLQIDFKKFIQVGGKAFVLALYLFVFLVIAGFVMVSLFFR